MGKVVELVVVAGLFLAEAALLASKFGG